MWRHPKYYKELRKRNKSDQAISLRTRDGECERTPDSGLKQQAIDETVPHCDIEEASSIKPERQASSKASSIKPTERQASSD